MRRLPVAITALVGASVVLASVALAAQSFGPPTKLGGGRSTAFGWSVAVSGDGRTALVGEPKKAGRVFAYARTATGWHIQGKPIVPSGASGYRPSVGSSVALSRDGNVALVAGEGNAGTGAVWVFRRSATTWSQDGPTLSDPAAPHFAAFGFSVALSADGKTALIVEMRGAAGGDDRAFIYVRSASGWSQQATLTPSDQVAYTGHSGSDIGSGALSADGSAVILGGPGENTTMGAVWIFRRSGASWSQEAGPLTPNDQIGNSHFGLGVALSADGSLALVGGYADNAKRGAIWMFRRTGTSWTQYGKKFSGLVPGAESRFFGGTVGLSNAGTTAVVGVNDLHGKATDAVVLQRKRTGWVVVQTISEPHAGIFGNVMNIAVSADAKTIVLGSPGDYRHKGEAWITTADS
jgi:hypothetical protein